MSVSKKHHYIPQFYLKGFINESSDYYIFDKVKEEIRKSNPLNTFYENNRNTGIIGEEKSVLLEEVYSYFENVAAPHFEKLKRAVSINDIDPDTFVIAIRFIALLYWRIPENDKKLEALIDEQTFQESGFDIINKETGESSATKQLQEQLKNVDLFRKMYRIFIPLISSREKHWKKDYENWRIYTRTNSCQLTGDNPIIIEKFVDFGSLNEELIFPISNSKTLVHTKRPKPTQLPSIYMLQQDMLILQQAKRFVCCSDKEYLEMLVNKLYSFSKNHDFSEKMKDSVFAHFK